MHSSNTMQLITVIIFFQVNLFTITFLLSFIFCFGQSHLLYTSCSSSVEVCGVHHALFSCCGSSYFIVIVWECNPTCHPTCFHRCCHHFFQVSFLIPSVFLLFNVEFCSCLFSCVLQGCNNKSETQFMGCHCL
jgi:hypothetical protein